MINVDRVRSLAISSALLASIAAIGIMIAAHLLPAGRLAEKSDIVTAFAGHVAIGAAAVLAALCFRRIGLALLVGSVLVAVVGHMALARLRQEQALWPLTDSRQHGDRLRIYQLNVWDHNPDLPRLERSIAAIDADIIVLAEADPSKIRMIERLTSRYPFQVSCAAHSECAMALLSRLPILEGHGARANLVTPPIVWARIDARSFGMGAITVVGTHVHRPTRNAWLHAMQIQSLGAIVASTKSPVVLAGDLNTGQWSAAYARLLKASGLVATAGLQPTWPAYPIQIPQVALDHILVSPDLVAVRSGLGPATGSDHLPVFTELKRKTELAAKFQ